MQFSVFCLIVLFGLVSCQSGKQFQADFSAYNDPTIQGVMTGTINHDALTNRTKNDYSVGGGIVSEYFDFKARLRYLFCTTCDAQTISFIQPAYNSDAGTSTGSSVTINGRSCTSYTIKDTNNPVKTIYSDSNGLPCRAVYTTGKTIDFNNVRALDLNSFAAITGWNCPVQTCNKMIDFVLIFDESGSIVPADFTREKQFGISVAQNYIFGPQNSGFALVQFSGDARTTIHMSFVQSSFLNTMNSIYQRGGSTCIGCGLQNAQTELQTYGRKLPNLGKVFIMLTDGMNNVNTNTFNQVLSGVKNAGIIIFSIGVGPAVDTNQINSIGSTIAGVTTTFPNVPSFSALQGIVNNLVISTCIDIAGTPCGTGCSGFCSCKGTCVCPSSCDDQNPCTDDTCTPGVNAYGCIHTTHACSDGNYCTQDLCNPALPTGCYFPTLVCSSPDACHNSTCDPKIGCQFPAVNCDDNNPCTGDSCNLQSGCAHVTVNCDKCKNPVVVTCPQLNCFNNQCNVSNGLCDAIPISCDDGNACTVDTCDATSGKCVNTLRTCDDGDACTFDGCDIKTGCTVTPYNVSVDCNDYSVCTIDTCDKTIGCVHTPINCDDNLTCTTNNCSSTTGCYFPPLDCLSNPRIAKFLGTCYQALCAEDKKGCYLDQLPGTTVDSCGVCNGNNQCVIVPLPSNVPYVIGGALLAVIIIGSIIVALALGAFGGKKGYDIWLAHRSNMSGASTNPLYNDNGLSGSNPMYSAKS